MPRNTSNTKEKVIEILKQHTSSAISGESIAKEIGVSRNSVWKAIKSLQTEGYIITSHGNEGYLLDISSNVISSHEIKQSLKNSKLYGDIIYFDSIDSTNTYAKQIASQALSHENSATVIISSEQTSGRGRLSRSFYSPKDSGIYTSILLKPTAALTLDQISFITLLTAIAVHKGIYKSTGVIADIKWPNDILWQNKKLCGILTECSVEGETSRLEYLIIGFGINLTQGENDFPDDIKDIAVSLKGAKSQPFKTSDLVSNILNEFEKLYANGKYVEHKTVLMDYYKKHLYFLNQQIQILKPNETFEATAIDVDNDGKLIIKHPSGVLETIFSGEISVRKK